VVRCWPDQALNLAVSLVTLSFALVARSRAVSVAALVPYLNEVAGLAVGGVASAFYGARFVSAIKGEHLIKTIAVLLAALGVLILLEVAYPFQYAQAIPTGAAFHFGTGFALGIIIGLVSSILGVAGGELLIPAMMFIFGADIKTAGTASSGRCYQDPIGVRANCRRCQGRLLQTLGAYRAQMSVVGSSYTAMSAIGPSRTCQPD
jgi:hypothetical protein